MTMVNNKECPNCGSRSTRREHTVFMTDAIEEIRTCDCSAEFVNKYALRGQEVVRVYE